MFTGTKATAENSNWQQRAAQRRPMCGCTFKHACSI